MAVASGPIAAPALSVPSSRWRSRPVQVALIVAIMLVLFALFRGDYPWPASLTWSQLPDKLDELQDWLLDERTAADPNIVFAIFEGFRVLADWLVTALTDALEWLTWVGTLAGSALLVWRFGGLRPALIVVAAWVSLRADGAVGGERADARAHARGGRAVARDRDPDRDRRRPVAGRSTAG